MTNITKKMTALAAAAFLTLSLAACGSSEPEDAPTLGAPTENTEPEEPSPSEETPTKETPTEAPTEAPEFDADDITVGTWAELDAYKAPEDADDIWGDKEASQGIRDAMEAMFMLYIDGSPAGFGGDLDRKVEDFAIADDFITEKLSGILTPTIKKAVKGDEDSQNQVRWFFPQAQFDGTLVVDGKQVLDKVSPGDNDYIVDRADAQVLESDEEYYLEVFVYHAITYHGTLNGEKAESTGHRVTTFSMLPAGDGSWKIDGIAVEIVDTK